MAMGTRSLNENQVPRGGGGKNGVGPKEKPRGGKENLCSAMRTIWQEAAAVIVSSK